MTRPDQEFERDLRQLLDQQADATPEATRDALQQARQAALLAQQQAHTPRRFHYATAGLTAAGLATAALALVLLLPQVTDTAVDPLLALPDLTQISEEMLEDPQMLEELEFALWLAQQADESLLDNGADS